MRRGSIPPARGGHFQGRGEDEFWGTLFSKIIPKGPNLQTRHKSFLLTLKVSVCESGQGGNFGAPYFQKLFPRGRRGFLFYLLAGGTIFGRLQKYLFRGSPPPLIPPAPKNPPLPQGGEGPWGRVESPQGHALVICQLYQSADPLGSSGV